MLNFASHLYNFLAMGYTNRLSHYLVKKLHCSHLEAAQFCKLEQIKVDGLIVTNPSLTIGNFEEISFQDEIIRSGIKFQYILFHKPPLYECTANREISDNIYQLLPPEFQHLFPVGRLDKNSQGLLLLTDDGSIYNQMTGTGNVEKEYVVTTFYPIDSMLEDAFTHPFQLGNRWTLPSKFIQLTEYQFSVTLREGINRQIRRICAKNNNQVKELVRVRFGSEELGIIPAAGWATVEKFKF